MPSFLEFVEMNEQRSKYLEADWKWMKERFETLALVSLDASLRDYAERTLRELKVKELWDSPKKN